MRSDRRASREGHMLCGALVWALAALVALAALATVACSRTASPTDAGLEASAVPPLSTPSSALETPSVPDASFELTKAVPVEARRVHVKSLADEPALGLAREPLAKHFGVAWPSPRREGYDAQIATLTARGRRAVLITEAGKPNTTEGRPFVFVEDGGVVWSRTNPVGGIMAPVGPVAIAPAQEGRVAMAACDLPTRLVALRVWDVDGSPFADFQAMTVEGCDAISLLYWPGRGFVIVVVRTGSTRAQLISENGALVWGQGIDVGARSKPEAIAPASVAADTDDTFMLVQMVEPSGLDGSPFHALAFRYDDHGKAIWPAAVDVGALLRAPLKNQRVALTLTRPGVRVTLPNGNEVDVRPSGDVIPQDRARP